MDTFYTDLRNVNSNWSNRIQSDSDLNGIISIGMYYVSTASEAATLSHCPITSNFVMIVLDKGGSNRTQLLIGSSEVFYRTTVSGSFSNWYKLSGQVVS